MRDQKPRGVPMDEWLLAIGLVGGRHVGRDSDSRVLVAHAARALDGCGWYYAAYDGAHAEKYGDNKYNDSDHSDPDMYVAGAALWEALNS